MIEIRITAKGNQIMDQLTTKDMTFEENCLVLRRVKEIEHELIACTFDSDIQVNTKNEDPEDDEV